mgnify:CR=1 FL=1
MGTIELTNMTEGETKTIQISVTYKKSYFQMKPVIRLWQH